MKTATAIEQISKLRSLAQTGKNISEHSDRSHYWFCVGRVRAHEEVLKILEQVEEVKLERILGNVDGIITELQAFRINLRDLMGAQPESDST